MLKTILIFFGEEYIEISAQRNAYYENICGKDFEVVCEYTGKDLEPWTENIINSVENDSKVVDISKNIDLIKNASTKMKKQIKNTLSKRK